MVTIFNDCRLNANQILKPLNHFPPMFPFQAPENITKNLSENQRFSDVFRGTKGNIERKKVKESQKGFDLFYKHDSYLFCASSYVQSFERFCV